MKYKFLVLLVLLASLTACGTATEAPEAVATPTTPQVIELVSGEKYDVQAITYTDATEKLVTQVTIEIATEKGIAYILLGQHEYIGIGAYPSTTLDRNHADYVVGSYAFGGFIDDQRSGADRTIELTELSKVGELYWYEGEDEYGQPYYRLSKHPLSEDLCVSDFIEPLREEFVESMMTNGPESLIMGNLHEVGFIAHSDDVVSVGHAMVFNWYLGGLDKETYETFVNGCSWQWLDTNDAMDFSYLLATSGFYLDPNGKMVVALSSPYNPQELGWLWSGSVVTELDWGTNKYGYVPIYTEGDDFFTITAIDGVEFTETTLPYIPNLDGEIYIIIIDDEISQNLDEMTSTDQITILRINTN